MSALIIPEGVGDPDYGRPPTKSVSQTEQPTDLIIPEGVGDPDYAEPVIQAVQPMQPIEQAPEREGAWTDFATGADRQTRATQELPELGRGGLLAGEELSSVSKIAPILAMTYDPAEVSKIIQTQFPHIRQTEDEKGNLILNNNKTGAQVVVNKPGFSGLDLFQGVAGMSAFTPAGVLSQVPKTVAQKIGTGALATGLTETAVQAGQEALGGDFDKSDIALSAGLGGLSESVPLIKSGISDLRAAKKLDIAKSEAEGLQDVIEKGEEAAEAVGGRLFQGQKTMSPTQLGNQSFLPQLPASTQKAVQQLKAQNNEAYNAVNNLLKEIAPDEAITTGSERFRTAAQHAIEKQKNIRKEKSSPVYNEAFLDNADVNIKPVTELIANKLVDAPQSGEVYKTLQKAENLISGEPSLKKLHNAKLEIDQMLNKFGETSLGNTTKKELTEVKNLLLDQIDDSSPLYKQARAVFAEETPAVLKMQDSIIGKIANLEDTQLKSISGKIFDPAQTNPSVIRNAKRVIKDVDPSAWNELLRVELEKRLGRIKLDSEDINSENVPGQLYNAIFGPKKSRDVLYNAFDGQTKKNLKYLETYLKRARSGRVVGSPTASREAIKDELKGGFLQGVRNLFSNPINTIAGAGGDIAFNNRTRAMADAVFDPDWTADMKALERLSPDRRDSKLDEILSNAYTKASYQTTKDTED